MGYSVLVIRSELDFGWPLYILLAFFYVVNILAASVTEIDDGVSVKH